MTEKMNNMQNLTPKELEVVQQKKEALKAYFETPDAKWDDYLTRCRIIDAEAKD